ncbi:hypothetical protein [Brevundimonas subvibrioides]|uniref:Uncharacterized protein n=1 Tax=Brevundimonas subvibrioides (strain ATCC 15264 / DSM 4735 / LMG 14903 / NBRC 16000 / CB 81) TaxID=633149 RepID=D9QIA4_BRESC|nr:hypothetical protein [Brevundimonas subvibrioides]ADK99406.1 hypothetical protein Bresu_0092 [Brevundimonas subvibrioides ATCC 15264]
MTDQPTLKLRPKLHRWLADRGLGARALAERWSITPQGASRYLLPFDHPKRIVPSEALIGDVLNWTLGEIGAADWYPVALAGGPLRGSTGYAAEVVSLPATNAVREATQ